MKKLKSILGFCIAEIIIVIIYLLVLNFIIGKVETNITADGIGYYDYLPSVIVYDDLNRKDSDIKLDSAIYQRIRTIGAYEKIDDRMVNIYPIGTALLQSPFFAFSYYFSKFDGSFVSVYQKSFQNSVFYAALFYLFFGLIFFRKTLTLYGVKWKLLILLELVILFATSLTYYSHAESSFSHVYSFFAISAFVYFTKSYFLSQKFKDFLLAALFLGLIIIIRQANIFVLLFLPFLAGSWSIFVLRIKHLLTHYYILSIGLIIVALIFAVQSFVWYQQTGTWLMNSYQNYSFNWFDPQIFNILFSFKKGLFLYAPVLFLSIISLFWLLKIGEKFLAFSWFLAFFMITYVLSSWFSWFYGGSYGLRAYIDYYTLIFIPNAIFLSKAKLIYQIVLSLIMLAFIPINLIQTYQYQNFILHWSDMDRDKYINVFLKTDDKYKGLLWKRYFDESQYAVIDEFKEESFLVKEFSVARLLEISSLENIDFDKINLIKLELQNDFNILDNSKLIFAINGNNNSPNFQYHELYLFHLQENGDLNNKYGVYYFEVFPIDNTCEKIISLELMTIDKSVKLKDLKITIFEKK